MAAKIGKKLPLPMQRSEERGIFGVVGGPGNLLFCVRLLPWLGEKSWRGLNISCGYWRCRGALLELPGTFGGGSPGAGIGLQDEQEHCRKSFGTAQAEQGELGVGKILGVAKEKPPSPGLIPQQGGDSAPVLR